MSNCVPTAAEGISIFTRSTTATDRMAEAATAYREGLVRQNEEMARTDVSEQGKDAYYGIHLAPLRAIIEDETPVPTTLAGAVAAIRFVAEDHDWVQTDHARVLQAALAFLTRPEPADPFLDLLTRYREQESAWNALPKGTPDTEFNTFGAATALPLLDELTNQTPAITTHRGAVEAIRQTLSEGIEHDGTYAHSAITAALAFFDGETAEASNLNSGEV